MKKIISGVLVVMLCFSLVACGGNKEAAHPEKQEPQEQVQQEPPAVQEKPVVQEQPEVPEQSEEQPTQPEEQPEEPGDISLQDVRQEVLDTLSVVDPLLLETDSLLDLYGIEAAQVKSSAGFVTMSGTFPDEIVFVEAVDEAAVADIQAKLEVRLGEVMVQSQTYDPENYQLAQKCKVRVNGPHLALILSPKEAEIGEIYDRYFA